MDRSDHCVPKRAGAGDHARQRSRTLRAGGWDAAFIGFFTPISRHFCETCNCVRLSAEGTLYLCLGQDGKIELRPMLRERISDEGLKDAIRDDIARQPERHEFREQPRKIVRFMSRTGS